MANPADQEEEFDSWNINYSAFYPPGSRRDREFRAARLLVFASRAWVNRIDTMLLRETGQSRARWQVMFALAFGEQPARLTEIAQRAHLQWPSLVKVIEGLEHEGLLERESNPADGRSKLVRLTSAGETMIRRIQNTLDRERAGLLQRLSEGELLMLAELLEKVFGTVLDSWNTPPEHSPLAGSSLAANDEGGDQNPARSPKQRTHEGSTAD